MSGRAALLAAIGLLSLGACGGNSEHGSTTSALADVAAINGGSDSADAVTSVGSCLDGTRLADDPEELAADMTAYGVDVYESMGNDPDWSKTVDCSEPHELSVYGVVTLPDDLDAEVAEYTSLLEADTPLAQQINQAVTYECAQALEPAAAVMAAAPLDLAVIPVTGAGTTVELWANPLPPHSWSEGERSFACLLEQEPAGVLMATDLVTSTPEFEGRVCLSGHDFARCDRVHDAERIAVLVINRAIDEHQLPGVRAVDDGRVDLGAEHWAELDETCDRYLREVSTNPTAGLVGVADTYPELYPDATGAYQVFCSAQSAFGTSEADRVKTVGTVFDQ